MAIDSGRARKKAKQRLAGRAAAETVYSTRFNKA